MFNPEYMATLFFRIDCKEKTKDWTKEQKQAFAKKLSEISLWDSNFPKSMDNGKEYWQFPELPDRKFTAIKIVAWMEELCLGLGYDVDKDMTKMVELLGSKNAK